MTGDEFEQDLELTSIAARLNRERPVPAPGFRGALRRRLVSAAERGGIAPERVRLWIASSASAGAGLLAIVAAGLAGVGPFGA